MSAEPNVVPMIDILLVLLIIFMIMQPMMRKAIDLQLPDPQPSVQPVNANADQIVLEVKADGQLAINKEPVTKERLGERLKEIYGGRPDKIMFVKGDPKVKYQDVIHAMDVARGSGVKVLGIAPKGPSE
jgi:biopolymer transport protein ExbD